MPYCTKFRATVSLLISLTSQRTNYTHWGHRFLEKTYQLNLPSVAVVIVEARGFMPSTFVCKHFEIKLYFTNGSINVQFNKMYYSQMAMLMRVPPRSTLEVCLAFHFHLPVHFRSLRLHLRSIPTACPPTVRSTSTPPYRSRIQVFGFWQRSSSCSFQWQSSHFISAMALAASRLTVDMQLTFEIYPATQQVLIDYIVALFVYLTK